ncbi:MAG: RsmB/NOP family class I SAM-dependent RNA methyltransferase [Parachlamydiales bacterium]
MNPFRHHHLLKLLSLYEGRRLSLPLVVNRYFREHKALGSKDRSWIGETAYNLMRWQGLWDYLGAQNWEERLKLSLERDPLDYQGREDIPPHIRVSFPEPFYSQLVRDHGEAAFQIALASNGPGPLTIRVNRLKGSREVLAGRLPFPTTPCKLSDVGLVVDRRRQLLALPEYQEGWFELQDEGSQWIAKMVGALPGEEGVDYCAGSGGKALALAAEMENKGQIYLGDNRAKMLYEARRRMRRAGVQNGQLLFGGIPERLKGRMDFVLVDAPCSGSGTLRRQPDAKWRLKTCSALQRKIVAEALPLLAPYGRLVYATCSLLSEENGDHLPYFERELGLRVEGDPFQSLPTDGGMDGFYGVVLRRCDRGFGFCPPS